MGEPLCFDTEFIPSQESWIEDYINEGIDKDIASLTPPKNYKDPEKIKKWLDDKKAELNFGFSEIHEKMVFNGATNNLISIGAGYKDDDIVDFTIATIADEAKIIKAFFEYVEKSMGKYNMPIQMVGHNIIDCDIPIIKQRCMILGIQLPHWFPVNIKPWEDTVYDTMKQWGGSYRDYIKLDLLARALGVESKGSIDGSMVYPMYKAGKIKEIGEYCRHDVTVVRGVHRKMTFQG